MPLGVYNPDWAIVKEAGGGQNKVYLVRETKGTTVWLKMNLSPARRQSRPTVFSLPPGQAGSVRRRCAMAQQAVSLCFASF
jgi:hypothetical protein